MANQQELKSQYSESTSSARGSFDNGNSRSYNSGQRVVAPDQNLQNTGSQNPSSSYSQQSYMQSNYENQYTQLQHDAGPVETYNRYDAPQQMPSTSSYSDNAQQTITSQTHLEHSDGEMQLSQPGGEAKPLGELNNSAFNQLSPGEFSQYKQFLEDHAPADVMMDPLLTEAKRLFQDYTPVRPGELCSIYGVTPGRASKIFQQMEKEGVVAKKPGGDDWVTASPVSKREGNVNGRSKKGERDTRGLEKREPKKPKTSYYQQKSETRDSKNLDDKSIQEIRNDISGEKAKTESKEDIVQIKPDEKDKAVLKREKAINAKDEPEPETGQKKPLSVQQKRNLYAKRKPEEAVNGAGEERPYQREERPVKASDVAMKQSSEERGTRATEGKPEPSQEYDPNRLNNREAPVKVTNPKQAEEIKVPERKPEQKLDNVKDRTEPVKAAKEKAINDNGHIREQKDAHLSKTQKQKLYFHDGKQQLEELPIKEDRQKSVQEILKPEPAEIVSVRGNSEAIGSTLAASAPMTLKDYMRIPDPSEYKVNVARGQAGVSPARQVRTGQRPVNVRTDYTAEAQPASRRRFDEEEVVQPYRRSSELSELPVQRQNQSDSFSAPRTEQRSIAKRPTVTLRPADSGAAKKYYLEEYDLSFDHSEDNFKLADKRAAATQRRRRFGFHNEEVFYDPETGDRVKDPQKWLAEKQDVDKVSAEPEPAEIVSAAAPVSEKVYSGEHSQIMVIRPGQMVTSKESAGFIESVDSKTGKIKVFERVNKTGKWSHKEFSSYKIFRNRKYEIVNYVDDSKKNTWTKNKETLRYIDRYRVQNPNYFKFNKDESLEITVSDDGTGAPPEVDPNVYRAGPATAQTEQTTYDYGASTGTKSLDSQREVLLDRFGKADYASTRGEDNEKVERDVQEDLVTKHEAEEVVRHDSVDEKLNETKDFNSTSNPNIKLEKVVEESKETEQKTTAPGKDSSDAVKYELTRGTQRKFGAYYVENVRTVGKDGRVVRTTKEKAEKAVFKDRVGDYWKKEWREAEMEEGNEITQKAEQGVTRIVRNQTRPFIENHIGHGKEAYSYQKALAKDEARKKTDAWKQKRELEGKKVSKASEMMQKRKNYQTARENHNLKKNTFGNNALTRGVGNFIGLPEPVEHIKAVISNTKMMAAVVKAVVSFVGTIIASIVSFASAIGVSLLPIIPFVIIVVLLLSGISGFINPGGKIISDIGEIDFDSRYYQFSTSPSLGNPYVCDPINSIAGPMDSCTAEFSSTGDWNSMMPISYASGRFWETNSPNTEFPLQIGWENLLNSGKAPGDGEISTDVDNPLEYSILSISTGSGVHYAFIEAVYEDGSIVISETNVNADNEFGFAVEKYSSLADYLELNGATLNAMYTSGTTGPKTIWNEGNHYPGSWDNCTWSAWQIIFQETGVQMPSFWGNAKNWYNSAKKDGWSVSHDNPQLYDVIVWTNGGYGHVGVVTDISEDGSQIYIKEGGYSGGYHEGWQPTNGSRTYAPGSGYSNQYFVGYIHTQD